MYTLMASNFQKIYRMKIKSFVYIFTPYVIILENRPFELDNINVFSFTEPSISY